MSGSGYVPNPLDPTQPLGTILAKTAAAEFRALKGFISTLANTEPAWNPLDKAFFIALVSGNLVPIGNVAANPNNGLIRATQGKVGAQRYYVEHTIGSSIGNVEVGLATLAVPVYTGAPTHLGNDLTSIGYRNDGNIWYGGLIVDSGTTFAPFDIIGIDFSAEGSVSFYRNNVLVHTQAWDASVRFYPKYPMAGLTNYNDYIVSNFGVTPFVYPVPADAVPFYEQATPVSGPQNLILNSDMNIDVRHDHTLLSPVVTADYLSDRWAYYGSVAGKFSSVAPVATDSDQQATQGCLSYQRFTILNSYVPAAAEFFMLTQRVEGVRLGRLLWGTANAKAITLSFYYRSTLAMTFSASLQNAARTRSFPYSFAVAAGTENTWQRASIVIPGPTSGVWNLVTDIGLDVIFSLGVGADYIGPEAGAWNNADDRQSVAATNFISTANGSVLDITGVEVRLGYYNASTPREIIDPSIQALECERYFVKRSILNAGYVGVAVAVSQYLPLAVPMRDVPTGIISNNVNTNCANSTFTAINTKQVAIGTVGVALGGFIQQCVASISAEL